MIVREAAGILFSQRKRYFIKVMVWQILLLI